MGVVGQHILQLGAGEVGLVLGGVEFGQLNFRARVGMIFRDLLPDIEQGVVGFAERGQRFGQRHHRVAVIVFGIFGDDAFEQRARFGGAFQAEQALAEMRAGVDVLRVAFQRGAVTGFGLGQFALLKINVAELRMMVRLVEMMDLRLEFLDAAGGCARRAIQSRAWPTARRDRRRSNTALRTNQSR